MPNLLAFALRTVAAAAVFTGIAASSAFAQSGPETRSFASTPVATGPQSGLPLPRFVSLKASEVNVRRGPSRTHAVEWVFVKAGLPVEIVAEFENWRRIRDAEGDEGWVHHRLLSGRRTALIAPWSDGDPIPLRARRDDSSTVRAYLAPGVLIDLVECDGEWCEGTRDTVVGYIPQESLWGVYPGEELK